jgi:hypothetical protein
MVKPVDDRRAGQREHGHDPQARACRKNDRVSRSRQATQPGVGTKPDRVTGHRR